MTWRRLLLPVGIVLTPLMVMGYVGLTLLLLVPFLGLRALFPRLPTRFVMPGPAHAKGREGRRRLLGAPASVTNPIWDARTSWPLPTAES